MDRALNCGDRLKFTPPVEHLPWVGTFRWWFGPLRSWCAAGAARVLSRWKYRLRARFPSSIRPLIS